MAGLSLLGASAGGLQFSSMKNVLLVALGGALGSIARYLVAELLAGIERGIPVHTLLVNVAGSFVLGVVLATTPAGTGPRLLLGVGVCGGFTTFSTFSAELVALAEGGAAARAAGYAGASLGLGLLATVGGLALGRALAGR